MLAEGELDRCLSALSHQTRRAIIDRLSRREARVTELADGLPVALNTVSKHVRVLEQAGLVRRRVAGRDHILTLDRSRLIAVRRWIDQATEGWASRLQAIDDYLARKAETDAKGEEP